MSQSIRIFTAEYAGSWQLMPADGSHPRPHLRKMSFADPAAIEIADIAGIQILGNDATPGGPSLTGTLIGGMLFGSIGALVAGRVMTSARQTVLQFDLTDGSSLRATADASTLTRLQAAMLAAQSSATASDPEPAASTPASSDASADADLPAWAKVAVAAIETRPSDTADERSDARRQTFGRRKTVPA